jgi:hypothetical protein
MPVFKPEYHKAIYFFGLLVFAAALPLSKYFMSLAQWWLILNWLLGGEYREKLNRLWNNKAALLIIGLFVLHLIGLIWTTDFQYAFKDIRIKLPLLVLPFILASEPPLSASRFRWILLMHALAVTGGSLFITWRVFSEGIQDAREASSLISHIRFALNICVALFSLAYFLIKKDGSPPWHRILIACVLIWLLIFLFILHSFTGLAVFGITAFIMLIRLAFRQSRRPAKIALGAVITIISLSVAAGAIHVYRTEFKSDPVDPLLLVYYTPRGNPYTHNMHNLQTENGHYLWLYVCYPELKEGWNRRSSIIFDSTDHSDRALQFTLIRFLASKGYKKDLDGVNKLTDAEVRAIEKGIASTNDLENPGFLQRIENVIWEIEDYKHTGDPTDHSLMQRIELWKVSVSIIADHPIIGVGTGDAPSLFSQKLSEMNSALRETKFRSHNQFLAIAVTFGIPGLLFFIFMLLYPFWKLKHSHDYFFFSFFVIVALSMTTEDTLESQPGVSFFIFFFTLFLFAYAPEEDINKQIKLPETSTDKDSI